MLLAVQQMVDALSALGITYKLLSTMDQPSTTAGNTFSTPGQFRSSGSQATNSASSSGGGGASAEECVLWQRQLLLEELVQPIHGSFCRLLQELGTLVGLVGAHVRAPTDAGRTALLSKVSCVWGLCQSTNHLTQVVIAYYGGPGSVCLRNVFGLVEGPCFV